MRNEHGVSHLSRRHRRHAASVAIEREIGREAIDWEIFVMNFIIALSKKKERTMKPPFKILHQLRHPMVHGLVQGR